MPFRVPAYPEEHGHEYKRRGSYMTMDFFSLHMISMEQ